VAADMRAQIGSCVVGERGILKLVEKYGIDVFESHKQYLFDSTENMMKAEIKTIPNGVYKGEAVVYYDGRTPGSTYRIRVKITVEDEQITFDYSETDPQTTGFVNGTYTSSASATLLTFLQMVNPDMPHNDGMVRPVKIIIPEGTILNARYPAATTFGNHLCPPNADAIMRALSRAIPERITAGWNQLLCYLTTGFDTRKNNNYVDIGFMGLKGGSGATKGVDGYDHIGMIDASGGVLDQDYEMFEQQTPHLLLKHEYWADSAGAGQWRGGLGVETEFRIGGEKTKVVTFGDGDIEPAFGLFNGKDSTLNKIELRYPDNEVYNTTTKDLVENVPGGTVLFQQAGGGGGYGDPRLRDAQKVAREVKNGIIGIQQARESYGVVVDPETFAVDMEETQRLRSI
jgi:N-methylhydantoinase B